MELQETIEGSNALYCEGPGDEEEDMPDWDEDEDEAWEENEDDDPSDQDDESEG
jgi:hypothetical protein